MSDAYCGIPVHGFHDFGLFTIPGTDRYQMLSPGERIAELQGEVASLKAEMRHREEAAYEHGLGSAAEVHRQNKIMAATIAALIDPSNRLNVRHA